MPEPKVVNDGGVTPSLPSGYGVLIGYIFLVLIAAISGVFAYYFITRIDESTKNFCNQDQLLLSEWSDCVEGIETRTAVPKTSCVVPNEIEIRRACTPKTKREYLFRKEVKEYTTRVDSNASNPYSLNLNNVFILPTGTGAFASARLVVTAITTVQGGKPYGIPEFYYFMLAMGNDVPHIIGSARKSASDVDTSDYGIFQGTQTPKTLSFDLTNLKAAKLSSEGAGSKTLHYLDLINKNTGQPIPVTLYIGDGRSMIIADEQKRIFGTITDAYIEYACTLNQVCNIQRLPPLPAVTGSGIVLNNH
jgi:hypothetical protein